MIKVKKIIVSGTSILINNQNDLIQFKGMLAETFDIRTDDIRFTYDEIDGQVNGTDPTVKAFETKSNSLLNS